MVENVHISLLSKQCFVPLSKQSIFPFWLAKTCEVPSILICDFGFVGVQSDTNLMELANSVGIGIGIGIDIGTNSVGCRPTSTRSNPSITANRIFFRLNSQRATTLRFDSVFGIGGLFPNYHRSPPPPLSVTVRAYSADQHTSPGYY